MGIERQSIFHFTAFERFAFRLWRVVWRRRRRRARRRGSDLPADHFDVPLPLQPEHVANCKVYARREDALADWPNSGLIAEVGTEKGDFAALILQNCKPFELHLLDIDVSMAVANPALSGNPAVRYHQGISWDVLATFPDDYFDVIYIDADHRQPAVLRDAAIAPRKLAPAGLLAFNDYTLWSPLDMRDFGVVNAVNLLCVEGGFEMVGFAMHNYLLH